MGSVIVLPPFLSVCSYPSAVRVPLGAVSQSPAYAASFHTAFSQTPDTLEMCNRYEAKQLLHMRLLDVGALQRILLTAWAGADNAGGRTSGNLCRRFLDAACGGGICVLIHTVKIVEISVASIGCYPVIIVERHRRIRVSNDVRNIERIAAVGFTPECIFPNAVQRMLPVINGELRQQRTVIKGVSADDWRGAGDLGSREIGTVLEPVSEIGDRQTLHVVEPNLRDLAVVFCLRLVVFACKGAAVPAAGDRQPALVVQLPCDLAVLDRAAGNGIICRKCRDTERKEHAEGKQECCEFSCFHIKNRQ